MAQESLRQPTSGGKVSAYDNMEAFMGELANLKHEFYFDPANINSVPWTASKVKGIIGRMFLVETDMSQAFAGALPKRDFETKRFTDADRGILQSLQSKLSLLGEGFVVDEKDIQEVKRILETL